MGPEQGSLPTGSSHDKAKRLGLVIGGVVVLIGLVVIAMLIATRHQQTVSHTKTGGGGKPPAMAVIEITTSGFVPSTLRVQANTDVVWVNEDSAPHMPAADPYPSHSSLPALVAPRALGQKETYSFLFTKPGTVHYHDDLVPTWTGTVEVD